MKHNFGIGACAAILLLLGNPTLAAPPIVTEPDGINDRVAEGEDFATNAIGNSWDMDSLGDIVTAESANLSGENTTGGIYSATTTSGDAKFWVLHPGLANEVHLDDGVVFPIDTSLYTQFSAKIRVTNTAVAQSFQVFFYSQAPITSNANRGWTNFVSVQPNAWQIITLDLPNETEATSPNGWSNFPMVRGVRIDPTAGAAGTNVMVEVDWVRITAPGGAPQQKTIQWTDNGAGAYQVDAVDSDGATLTLASSIAGTSTALSFSLLPPGDYTVAVTGNGETGSSGSPAKVNESPILHLLQPDIGGDPSASYGNVELGNPWGPMDAADTEALDGLTNVSYSAPVGSLSARPTSSDPRIRLNTPTAIDTNHYRMLCVKFQVFGSRVIGGGSVFRILWGDNLPSLRTSEDIVVEEGLNTYCLGDLKNLPIDAVSPGTQDWTGSLNHIRFDPHEFPVSATCTSTPSPANCHDVQLDSFVLAPFDTAAPNFTISWTDTDSDDDASIDLLADPDQDPNNGNETLIVSGLSENSSSNSHLWNAGAAVADGTYYILARITDGFNSTERYSTGPLVVMGAGDPNVILRDGFE